MPTFPVADPDLFTRWRPQNVSYKPPTSCFAVYLHNVGNDFKVVDVHFAVDVTAGGVVDIDFDFDFDSDSDVYVALLKCYYWSRYCYADVAAVGHSRVLQSLYYVFLLLCSIYT